MKLFALLLFTFTFNSLGAALHCLFTETKPSHELAPQELLKFEGAHVFTPIVFAKKITTESNEFVYDVLYFLSGTPDEEKKDICDIRINFTLFGLNQNEPKPEYKPLYTLVGQQVMGSNKLPLVLKCIAGLKMPTQLVRERDSVRLLFSYMFKENEKTFSHEIHQIYYPK